MSVMDSMIDKATEMLSEEMDFVQKHPTIYKIDEQLTYQNGFEHGYNQAITEMMETGEHDELSQSIAINIFERGVEKGRADAIKDCKKQMVLTFRTHYEDMRFPDIIELAFNQVGKEKMKEEQK